VNTLKQMSFLILAFFFFLPPPFLQMDSVQYEPCITEAFVAPEKVTIGSLMVISVTVKDNLGITSVQAKNYHENGYDIISLQLASGTIYYGVWGGTWVVHDTKVKEYTTVVTAFSHSGLSTSVNLTWFDPASWWDLEWSYRKLITLNHTQVSSDQINFPILLNITDTELRNTAQSDGDDIAFTDDSSHKLNHQIERYVSITGALVAWVNVTNLSSSSDTQIYMYYGNSECSSQQNPHGVWDSNYLGVWHLNETSGTILDSSGNGKSGTLTGATYAVDGKIGKSISFDGSGDYIDITIAIPSTVTISAWSQSTTSGLSDMLWCIGNTGTGGPDLFFYSGNIYLNTWDGVGNLLCVQPNVNQWHLYTTIIDSVANNARLYIDGRLAGTAGYRNPTKATFAISSSNGYDWQGTIDEFCISKIARPATWINTGYNNVNNATNGGFFTVGSEELALPTRPTLTAPDNNSYTTDTMPTFQWINGENQENNTLYIDGETDFSDDDEHINISLSPSTTSYITPVEKALSDGRWYWKVVANNTQGTNGSDVWSCIIDTTAPEKPHLYSPSDNYETNNNHVTFSWNETADNTTHTSDVSGISSYQLQISNDNFTSFLVNQNTSGNITLSITVTVAGRVQWRVRAWDQAGNPGIFSETRNLTVFDFSLTATSSTLTILRGGIGSTTIQIQKSFGDDEEITLTNEWSGIVPTGVSVDFSTISGNGSFTSVIDFETSGDASTGEFTLNVLATSLTGTRTLPLTIRIAGMIFQMSASPTAFTLTRSDADESRVSVTFQYGSKGIVSLSGGWIGSAPLGVTTTFSHVTDLPPFDSILSISTSNQASSGKYTYKITATGGGISDWIYISLEIKTNLTLTLQSDKTTYEKGQEIHLSGTAHDPNGNAVKSGMVTLNFSTGTWSEQITCNVTNGFFQTKYFVTFDKFEGNWVVSGTAIDSLGHQTTIATQINIVITIPETYKYYTITVISPLPGQVYKRGEEVSFTVSIVENETKIREATVSIQSPDGAKIFLSEISPGLYTKSYKLKMNSKLGNWSVYIAGSTGENEMFKAGFSYIPIKVEPTQLSLEIIEPTTRSFETGEKITLLVKLFYLEGSPVEEGIVSITKTDGTILNFKKSGNGLYTTGYTVTDEDLGYLNMEISATDVYGNLGVTKGTTFAIIPMQVSSYFVRYWWITSGILIGLIVALGIVTRDVSRTVRLRNFKREVIELSRLKKDKAIEYFITGSISRETYDNLLQEYESKLAKLEKQRHILEKKMQKKRFNVMKEKN